MTPGPLHEGTQSNLCEGEGETGEIEEPRSPIELNQPLNSPDKGSAAKILVEGTHSPQPVGAIIIPNQGSGVKTIPVKTTPPQPRNTLLEIPEDYWHIFDPMAQNQPNTQTSTLQYPIVDSAANAPMKAIPLQHIPTFHGLTSEDPGAFLFEFDVLCRGYDYTTDPQKLKLFPSTLKGAALRWFMGLGGGVINNWDQMKEAFLKKYQDYCRSRELKDEIFQMSARPNETLEEYVERFQYNLQRSPYASLPLPDNVLKTALIRGMREQWIETLNIMGKGDIYQENFADIIDLCIRSSRGSTRIKPAEYDRFPRDNRTLTEGVTWVELGNLLENFKTDILGTLTTQLDIVQAKQKQAEAKQNLAVFCPRCRKKHSHKECPLDTIQICAICTKDHLTESCPSLPGLKAVYKEAEEEPEPAYFINQRRQWHPRQSSMFSDPSSSFQPPQFNTQQQNMWQNQSQPPFSNWSPQMFPTPNPWMSQFGWPNFPYPPPYWQNNSYPPQWTPSTSQSSSWQTSWTRLTYQPVGSIPFPQPTLPALQQNPQPNLRPQLPAQPNPNPNNRPVQSLQIIEPSEIESDLRECNDLQLRSGRIIETEGHRTTHI